jgi:hypothetical protein
MSTSEKYDKAVAKATGTSAHGTQEISTPVPKGAESMVQKFHPDALIQKINDDLASGKFEAAPQIFKIEEGMVVEGFLEGNGPDAEFTDAETGEVTTVRTWIIANENRSARISILSSTQLDKKLNGFIGSFVKVARGREVNISGTKRRMTEYMVWGPKLPSGQSRQWFDVPNEARLASGNHHGRALPAPSSDHEAS